MFPSGGASRPEQLFHAAIAAFCALSRPSRAEVAQIDDLTQPLLALVPAAARRFAAAAFSDLPHAPPGLVRRLCDEAIDIAAPLLVRSPLLSDIDLVGLIGRHGAAHAQAIARRPGLHPAIAQLVRALEEPDGLRVRDAAAGNPSPAGRPEPSRSDAVRRRLRTMMAAAGAPSRAAGFFERLRDTALSGHAPFFETALADVLGLSLSAARRIAGDPHDALPRALDALGLTPEQGFLVAAAAHPGAFAGRDAIRGVLARFGPESGGGFEAPGSLRRA